MFKYPHSGSCLLTMWSDLHNTTRWRDCVGMYLQRCLAKV